MALDKNRSTMTELSEIDLSLLLSQLSTASGDDEVTDRTIEDIIREAEELTKSPVQILEKASGFTNIFKSEIDTISKLSDKLKNQKENDIKTCPGVNKLNSNGNKMVFQPNPNRPLSVPSKASVNRKISTRPITSKVKMVQPTALSAKPSKMSINQNDQLLQGLKRDNARFSLEINKIKEQLQSCHGCLNQGPICFDNELIQLIRNLRDELQLCRAAIENINNHQQKQPGVETKRVLPESKCSSAPQRKPQPAKPHHQGSDIRLLVTIRGLQAELAETKREMKRLQNELAKAEKTKHNTLVSSRNNKKHAGCQTLGLAAVAFPLLNATTKDATPNLKHGEVKLKMETVISERNNNEV